MNLRGEPGGNSGKRAALILWSIGGLLVSCGIPGLVAPFSAPGSEAQAAAETDNAAFTQTALSTPLRATSTPTAQPTITAIATPTSTIAPSLSHTPEVLGCQLLWQSPRSGTHYGRKENFNMGWSVKNTSTIRWDPISVSFVYLRGSRLHRDDRVQLPASVAPGGRVVLTAPLRSPKVDGTYTTVWALRRGQDYFCALSLRINVP